jgi:excinuclease ABC subunit A
MNIKVTGAREHNLKNIDVEIPRDQFVVITGLSGSGKSSLAFDTIYAEGQRRYMESLNSYARMFVGTMTKPDVDKIEGLSPAISIDQKSASRNPRSTVATVTEIYDYLRLLYARIGVPHCPKCGKEVQRRTLPAILDDIMEIPAGTKLMLLAPIAKGKKGQFEHIPEQFMRRGFARARVDGVVYALDEFPTLAKQVKHNIELVVDRFMMSADVRSRLSQSVEQALEIGGGTLELWFVETDETRLFSQNYACPDHPDEDIPELEPRLFSFNAPYGACPTCTGLGICKEIDPELILNRNLTIMEGAIKPYNRMTYESFNMKKIAAVAEAHGFSLRVPVMDMRQADLDKILYGTGAQKYQVALSGGRFFASDFEGVIPNLERRWRETDSDFMRREIERYMRDLPCNVCRGTRLKPVVQAVTVHGLSIVEVCDLSVADALKLLKEMQLTDEETKIGAQIVKEIVERLNFMNDVGLNYLELKRAANTLSGGEAQRIRLATQIGSGLQGVLYILDEPSIGLHQRDNDRLITSLKNLRDLGNTVIVVEHDEDTIRNADYLIDVGPGAGVAGGEIVAVGTPSEVAKNPASITGRFLAGTESIKTPRRRRPYNPKTVLRVVGAREHNLQNLTVEFPLGLMTVVAGVSGSGKSTLVNDILAAELERRLNRAHTVAGRHDNIEGVEHLDKAIVIDQSPIGRTPRSNPATYTGIFTPIRDLFAATPEANVRGYKSGRFSFNVHGGRCENCQGEGQIKIEMHFLPDVFVECSECHGKRYNPEVLEIKWNGKSIADVLAMTVDEAAEFFQNIPRVADRLNVLREVGLGYITLGQSATTFSGGEAQRIKLSTELSKRATGKTLYILDEPTTGLHAADVRKLLEVLNKLVSGGNSAIIIEHNLDVIKCADHIVDMGPEGGAMGGQIVATGTPEEVAQNKRSFTGQYLKMML